MKKNKKAFTIIELLVAILIISIVLLSWFQLFSMAMASKVKISEQTALEKNIFYFSEKLFSLVKKWWTLDYEEYFNRALVSMDEQNYKRDGWKKFILKNISNWHFQEETWFWNFWLWWNIWTNNFWEKFYYCISAPNPQNWVPMNIDWWCYLNPMLNINSKDSNIWVWKDYLLKPQRYWQYSYQFIDYNSDWNNDKWDTNGDWIIIRDDDDKHLWQWSIAFSHNEDLKELYLISWDKKRRTFFRWNIKQDEFVTDSSKSCDATFKKENWHYVPNNPTNFAYCRWTIEFLELEGKDWWMKHNVNDPDEYTNDWVIDTWVIASNFSWRTNSDFSNSIIAWTLPKNEMDKYWKPLFSDDINISDFKVFAYPHIDSSKVWIMSEEEQKRFSISPYVVLSFEVKPSWKVKSKIKWDIKPVKFNTTINLTDIFSNSN